MMTIGERIKMRRKTSNITADELADKVGTDRSNFYKWESGTVKNIPASAIPILAEALNTTADYLLGITDYPDITNERPGIDWSKVEMALKVYSSVCDPLTAEERNAFHLYL